MIPVAAEYTLPRMRACRIALTLAASLLALAVAAAADAPPPTPQARYDDARQAMQRGRYADAEAAFRSVADAGDAPADLRAQALFSVALMQQNQRQYETALQSFAEVQRRFPDTPVARRAADAAAGLTEGGDQGLAFKRRFDEVMDAYAPARDALDRDDFATAQPGFERAVTLLAAIERDFPTHPRVKDVAFLSGETHAALARFVEARADYERAVALGGGPRDGDTFVTLTQERIVEVVRARNRQVTTRAARTVLIAIGLAFLLVRPWTGVDAALFRLGGRIALGTFVLSAVSVIVAWFIREYVDDHSPVTHDIAVMLVLLPGLAGVVVSLGFVGGLRTIAGGHSPWPVRAGAMLGALAAFAVAVCVVNAYELFPFLDSML